VGVALTAAVVRAADLLPAPDLLPAADRFLEFPELRERDLELAIAGGLHCSQAIIVGLAADGPEAAGGNYLASVSSSF
jgi:hypothetical protein